MINLKHFNNFIEELYKDFDISKLDKFSLLFELLVGFYEVDIDFTSIVEDYIEKNNLDDSMENHLLLIDKLCKKYMYLVDKYEVEFAGDCNDFDLDQDSQVHFYLSFTDKIYRIYLVGVYYYENMLIYIDEVVDEKVIGEEMDRGINNLDSFNKYIN